MDLPDEVNKAVTAAATAARNRIKPKRNRIKPKPEDKEVKGVPFTLNGRKGVDFTRPMETPLQLNLGYVTGRVVKGEIHIFKAREVIDSESYCEDITHSDIIATQVTPGLRYPSGVVTILGASDAAKSPLADFLAGGNTLNFGEPLPGDLTRAAEACAEMMSFLLDSDAKIISFDSVKNLLTRGSSGGGAGARGVSRAIFPMLSDWSSVASSLGKTIVVPINISTSDLGAMEEIKEAMRSNVNMHIFAAGSGNYQYLSRVPGKGKRIAGAFSVAWSGNKISKIAVSGAARQFDENSLQDEMVDSASVGNAIPASLFKSFINKD